MEAINDNDTLYLQCDECGSSLFVVALKGEIDRVVCADCDHDMTDRITNARDQ